MLEQVAFVASPALPKEVVQGFAEATRSVPLTQTGLGIVRTAVEGTVTVCAPWNCLPTRARATGSAPSAPSARWPSRSTTPTGR